MWDYKCENCGATLDPGELCDCDCKEREKTEEKGDVEE